MSNICISVAGIEHWGPRGVICARRSSGSARTDACMAVSSFYETEPVEVTDQAWFLNCAVALETSKRPLN